MRFDQSAFQGLQMDLVGVVENPIPRGPIAGFFYGRDGAKLRYARWRPSAGECHGTVCLFTGRGDFIEKYFEVISELRRRGFAVVTMDWRGQGRSARVLKNVHKGHINRFGQYYEDLVCFMEQVVLPESPAPFFAMAHSMGATIILRAGVNGSWFTRIVVLSPMIGLVFPLMPRSLARALAHILNLVGFGEVFVPGGHSRPLDLEPFAGNRLSSDPFRYQRTQKILEAEPGLGVGWPTIGWLDAAFDAMSELKRAQFPTEVKVPILLFSAGADQVVSNRAIEKMVPRIPAVRHIVIRGSRHEILMEKDYFREQMWAAFDAFIPGAGRRTHPGIISSVS